MKALSVQLLNAAFARCAMFLLISTASSAAEQALPPARTLAFPAESSLGRIRVIDSSIERKIEDFYYWVDGTGDKWEYLGEAKREVKVPLGKRVALDVNKDINNLSALTRLAPDDVYMLRLGEAADDNTLRQIRCLTGLKVLIFAREPGPDKKPSRFTPEGLQQLSALKSLERMHAPQGVSATGLAAIAEALPQLRAFYCKSPLTDSALALLPRFRNLEELEAGGKALTSLGLAHLAEMRSVYYLALWGVKDYSLIQVRKMPALRTLLLPQEITDQGVANMAGHPLLEVLSLYNTPVTDKGVAHLKTLPSLRKVDLSKRDFDRKRPPITDAATVHLKEIKALEYISLPADGLTDAGLINLAGLKDLKTLRLNLPNLIDTNAYMHPYTTVGIREISKLHSLQELHLGGPGVTDAALADIGKLTNLVDLVLFGVPVGKQGIAALGRLTSLESLYLGASTAVSLSDLNALNNLHRLRSLTAHALARDAAPMNISGLKSLERLSLSWKKDASLEDRDLACLQHLKALKWVQVGSLDLPITDTGFAYLAGLSSLDRLVIGGPALTDRSLGYLSRMPKMSTVRLRGNFTDSGLRQLEGLSDLASVWIYSSKDFAPEAERRLRKQLPQLYKLVLESDKAIASPAGGGHGHPKPGTVAPDFTVTTLDGSKFTLSEQRGKVVLLHFWGTCCAPCVKSLPALKASHERIKRRYGDRVVLLDLVMDDDDLKLRNLLEAHSITTPQAHIGFHSKLAASYGVTSAPDDFMIGPDNRILLNRESPEGPSDTERVIDNALGISNISKPQKARPAQGPIVIRR